MASVGDACSRSRDGAFEGGGGGGGGCNERGSAAAMGGAWSGACARDSAGGVGSDCCGVEKELAGPEAAEDSDAGLGDSLRSGAASESSASAAIAWAREAAGLARVSAAVAVDTPSLRPCGA
jgi:hypothetical protein